MVVDFRRPEGARREPERALRLLIVQAEQALGGIWARHLERAGHDVALSCDVESALILLSEKSYDVIVLDLGLADGLSLTVAAYAEMRQPEAKVIFVTNSRFFSDGSIFALASNACAFITRTTPPGDLAAMVEHHGKELGGWCVDPDGPNRRAEGRARPGAGASNRRTCAPDRPPKQSEPAGPCGKSLRYRRTEPQG